MSDLNTTLNRLYDTAVPDRNDIVSLLSISDADELKQLFTFADHVRKQHVGDGVLLRGIVEFSNFCGNNCAYCGLKKDNTTINRYRLSVDEILQSIGQIYSSSIRTVVLQSGEEHSIDAEWMAKLLKKIKSRFDIAVTLSVGERSYEDYELWRKAGADRYLLKIETTDKQLYNSLHPDMSFEKRIDCLRTIKQLGYQSGTGCIVGLKGQTIETLANDIMFFAAEQFDMLGIGPFIPHQDTPLKDDDPGELDMILKTLAVTRIVTKDTHMPATTAIGSLNSGDERLKALQCGANVMMPNYTPQPYKKDYEIYPGKRCIDEPSGACANCMEQMAQSIGRYIDYSRGDSLKTSSATTIQ
ncbi:MAG: [FeFe] hydrogenase H-cluster radical SAM maturase HydE [Anaerohalosphaera sp.]|nr:[FeFe] hydrogenase H-cluster radical SAM maturase HydE [Anaerohalosphaera sp.]